MYDILAHPDLVKVWGRERPGARRATRASTTSVAIEGMPRRGVAVEVSTAGLRKPVGEIYPARAFLEMAVDAGSPIALSSDAHAPEHLGCGYDQALELLDDARRHRDLRVRAPRQRAAGAGIGRRERAGDDRHRVGQRTASRRAAG